MCIVWRPCRTLHCHPICAACQICHTVAAFHGEATNSLPVRWASLLSSVIHDIGMVQQTDTQWVAAQRKAATVWQI
jgi:hypothetical protein